METGRQQQLDDLLECSQSLLDLAHAGDWTAVSDQQGRYRELAEALFCSPVAADDAVAVDAVIRDVLRTNRQILELGAVAKHACLDEMGEHRKRHKAVSEYAANQPRVSG